MGVSGEGGEVMFMQSLGCWLCPPVPYPLWEEALLRSGNV